MNPNSLIYERSRFLRIIPGKWWVMISSLLLSALTVLLLEQLNRYLPSEEQLIDGTDFSAPLNSWQQRGSEQAIFSDNKLLIVNSNGASHTVWQNIIVSAPTYIRFQFDGRAIDVKPGSNTWSRANGALIYYDKEGERISSRMIGTLDGTTQMRTFHHIEKLNELIGSVDVAFRLLQSSGQFEISNPLFQTIDEAFLYKAVRATIAVCWAVLFVVSFVFLVRNLHASLVILGVAIVSLVFMGALLPEHVVTAVTQRVAEFLPGTFLTIFRQILASLFGITELAGPGAEISKVGHFLGFVLLGLFAGFTSIRQGVALSGIGLITIAIATETLQLFTNTRTPSLNDLALDIAGGLIGLLTCLFLVWVTEMPRSTRH